MQNCHHDGKVFLLFVNASVLSLSFLASSTKKYSTEQNKIYLTTHKEEFCKETQIATLVKHKKTAFTPSRGEFFTI